MTRSGSPDPAPAEARTEVFEGVYGSFTITPADRREVLAYRLSLISLALCLGGLLISWDLPSLEIRPWLWPAGMVISLGLALNWIHIYLRPLHRLLQVFWLVGSMGMAALLVRSDAGELPATLLDQRLWLLAVGPFFAALTGIGFKEFFCFRRPEAIGVTLLLPLALLGLLLGVLPPLASYRLMLIAAALLLVLGLRKLPMEAAADVGDKSVFAHLDGAAPGIAA
ncbi:hypothetical protein EVJ50_13350 [Synechococcus sp. RSCCF101]|uniref:DUF2301 domain-containing membrane protein n=1 Tax=Synechococcus sp. RSCCF101 TaxID=2511069 RepID=UPI0012490DCB|nr:DUF2301 domain-containing membrane protein [Synechococcus sp. RSCCF101]QEY33069.1 hypothetical protein EVJ50_13350 [Synechococcus sp. RSCCF101]